VKTEKVESKDRRLTNLYTFTVISLIHSHSVKCDRVKHANSEFQEK